MPLAVIVMIAALPTGSNALIFAQRYRALEAEVTAATVVSTILYVDHGAAVAGAAGLDLALVTAD